jgi:hypothetical protein
MQFDVQFVVNNMRRDGNVVSAMYVEVVEHIEPNQDIPAWHDEGLRLNGSSKGC